MRNAAALVLMLFGWAAPPIYAQMPGDCLASLSPSPLAFGLRGGVGAVAVQLPPDPLCGGWLATTTAEWIVFPGSHSGGGNGSFAVQALPNITGTLRTAIVTLVARQPTTMKVVQAARDADAPAVADLDADGKPDLIWHHVALGATEAWAMNGVARASTLGLPPVEGGWKLVGAADFNADGKPDLLWHHQLAGNLGVWLLDGTTVIGTAALSPAVIDPSWQVVGVADFNSDGKPDLLWQHHDGWLGVWLMDGVTRTATLSLSVPWVDPSWRVAAAADFSGDGKPDLLWRHRGGALGVWAMDGVTALGAVACSPDWVDPSWHVASVVDLNADGRVDLLWINEEGSLGVWYMDGVSKSAVVPLTPNRANPW